MKKYSILNTILLTIALIISSLGLIALADKYILTVNFYETNGQPVSGIPEMEVSVYRNVQHIIYFYSAIYLVVKIGLIALILYASLNYANVRIYFRNVLRVVVLAEFIFLIPAIIKIVWFHYYNDNPSLEQWQQFYFLSAATVIDNIKPVFLYPLQTLNAFEIGYWFLLAAGIKSVTALDYDRSLRMVLFSYVPALLIWMVMVAFFTVVYFPQQAY